MLRRIRLYFHFVGQHFKMMLQYRADFLIGILSFVFIQAAGILFLDILVRETGLYTWTYFELLVIYAMFQLPRGIDHLLTDNLWMVGYYIRRGLFDKYLVRPMSVLWHVIIERFQLEAIGELLVGAAVLAYALPNLSVQLDFVSILYLAVFIILGALMYTSIKLATAAVAFWTKDSMAVQQAAYEVSLFTKNPLEIYPRPLRFLLVYVLPFGFTSFFPSVYLLSKFSDSSVRDIGLDWIVVPTPAGMLVQAFVTTAILMTLSLMLWKKGLSRYESAGS
ncbi:MAG: ABC-2 family transporter protein [bacterium]